MSFGENLKEIRGFLDITQEDLAKKCGISATTLSHFESGQREPSMVNLRKLKNGIGCSYDKLLVDKEPQQA